MLDLRSLQLQAESEYSVESTRESLGKITKLFKEHEVYEEAMDIIMVQERKLSIEIARECDCFFVPEDTIAIEVPEELQHESLGFMRWNRLVFSGRLVYPVKDVKGQVMGFCGWDNADTPKYLDSKNHGYLAKHSTLFGMEKLEEYYRSGRTVFVVEGIVCCLYLRSKGFQALALLGTTITPYMREILNRFGIRLVVIPDNDTVKDMSEQPLNKLDVDTHNAGNSLVKTVIRILPSAFIIQTINNKDIDDTRQNSNEELLLADLKVLDVCAAFPVLKEFRRRR